MTVYEIMEKNIYVEKSATQIRHSHSQHLVDISHTFSCYIPHSISELPYTFLLLIFCCLV